MQNNGHESKNQMAAEGEIDLVDLFLVLWNRKLLIFFSLFACVLAGSVYCLVKVDTYEYVTTFEIGTLLKESDKTDQMAVESPEIVKVKLDQVYIPKAVKARQIVDKKKYKAKTSIQKKSDIILITSSGTEEQQPLYESLHGEITKPMIAEHQIVISAAKNEHDLRVEREELKLKELQNPKFYAFDEKVLKGDIGKAEAQLVKLSDERVLLTAKKGRLNETQAILKDQIGKVEHNLSLAYANRPKATTEVNDEAKALTFLMLNSQIEQYENRLASLKERLSIQLEDQKQLLENQLANNSRDWQLQKDKVSELKSRLDKLQAQRESNIDKQKNVINETRRKTSFYKNSRVLGLAQRSLDPAGPGKIVVLALSAIAGLIGGVLLAFMAEFVGKVREQTLKAAASEE